MIFRFREKEFWILIASGLVLFYRPLFLGETFFYRDLHLHFYPQKLRFVELIRNGEFPLWDSYLHGGQPFLADLNNMALYPFNLVYLALPSLFAFNMDIIFHVLFSAAATYWLCRFLGITPLSSMIAGGIYAFCGYSLSLTNLLSRLTAMPYLPLMILTLHGFFVQRKAKWFVLCAIFGSFQILAGAPEMTILTILTLFGWSLFNGVAGRPVPRLAVCLALTLLVGGISAIQIVPTLEMLQQSERSTLSDYDSFSAWSLHQKRIPEMIFPGFLGRTDGTRRSDYWGANLESMGFPFILSIYFGWLALSLAVFGTVFKHSLSRLRVFLFSLTLLFIVLSMGRFLPGFAELYAGVPLLTAVRYPIKFLAGAILPISLLAAFGLDTIFQRDGRQKRIAFFFWVSAVVFTSFALLFRLSPDFARDFLNSYFGIAPETAIQWLNRSFLHVALVCLAATCFYQHWIFKPGKQHVALSAVLLFDLIWVGFDVNHFAPNQFFEQTPALVSTVKKELGPGRFYRAPHPHNLNLNLPANEVVYFNRWHLETLHNYSAALYSIPVIYHEDFDNLAQNEVVRISDHLLRLPWEQRLPFLTAGAVSLFLAPDHLTLPGVHSLATAKNTSGVPFFLYRNSAVSSQLFFVPEAIRVSNNQEAFRKMNEPGFHPLQTVLISANEDIPVTNPDSCRLFEIVVAETKASRIKFHTRSDCDSFLYFAQPFYKGWIARVDGTESTVFRANYAFSASFVKAGEHTIERIYRPESVKNGMIVTSISAIFLFVLSRFLLRRIV
ncbi:hypothetical protein L0222_03905 [bacterium]|nr:hypothetical protein [bacterium]MCI0605764.1 hypothetical protein [bacterium]